MATTKTILITGGGTGFGEGVSLGLAKAGYNVIAGVHISPQVTSLRRKAKEAGVENKLRVEKLDILDAYDVKNALTWDVDILFNNAGYGESGPVFEIPVDLLRKNFETNVFAPLELSQKFAAKFIKEKKKGKIVFTSSMGGLVAPVGLAPYCTTKFALEGVAEALQQELAPYGIQVQTINPGGYFTGFNERVGETAFRWLDDTKNFTKKADLTGQLDLLLGNDSGRLDPEEMISAMIKIIPADTGKYRNVLPQFIEDFLKDHQQKVWQKTI
ncbi:SDR family oxidoreductase [Chitinophagaceae bacterium 26-R-25]|nr:SDR family oxidoreductase [Chitinophagaceae bacterium 26-R-25]